MKKIAILSAIALSGLIFSTADAQVRIHVGLNLGPARAVYTQRPVVVEEPVYQEPVAAPVYDDGDDDDYYYLPEVDAYYSVNAGCYYYNNGYSWIRAAYLPGVYRDYDWRRARRYEIHEHRPFLRADVYRTRYNGRVINEWRHGNYNRGYDNHYGNRGYNNWGDRREDNHGWNRGNGGFGGSSSHYRNWGDRHDDNRNWNNNRDHGQRGFGQPGRNNGRGNERGGEHFAGNRPAAMGMSHRPATF
ncbi:hypothetical protein [Mucilaginibacter sp. L3T2-6]|uniref:hypothetical protein n=1 Tax=Mucilaginibacter sp. L3T2-6 TaxID=3062491 RepID=UPI0026768042|nr:hypothetical protein [Mucilaginibacter sp. L3T2-6]MDO3644100.1 hypothetical protein [Mucilaginibacter sp. L3T2-6]MDV6216619.1 hypothetical protein [Mucilaginibacter sp. L3T2-6]